MFDVFFQSIPASFFGVSATEPTIVDLLGAIAALVTALTTLFG